MKLLKTKIMKQLLNRGIRMAKKERKPSNGTFLPLFQKELKNGWAYQVDYLNDSRVKESPCVIVHAFKPPRVYYAISASHYLYHTMEKK